MLENVKNLLSDGVTALGGILIVFGLVNLGLTIKDGMQGGGGQLSGALAMIIGGAIVVGAAVYFKGLSYGHVRALRRLRTRAPHSPSGLRGCHRGLP